MIIHIRYSWIKATFTTLFMLVMMAAHIPVQAQQEEKALDAATPWVETDYGRSRLIFSHQGLAIDNLEPYFLGWEIELNEGWKTYWRSPGDAGKPTTISFEGSENLKNHETYYPMPMRFELFGITTYGYENHLILPISLEVEDRNRAMTVQAKVNYMVCEKVCVLLDHDYHLRVPAKEGAASSAFQQAIMTAVAAVPKAQSTFLDGLKITQTKVYGPVGHQSLMVELTGINHLSGADIIVESEGGFHFGIPQRQLLQDGKTVRFIVKGKSYDRAADLSNQDIIITMIDGWGGVYERRLPASSS